MCMIYQNYRIMFHMQSSTYPVLVPDNVYRLRESHTTQQEDDGVSRHFVHVIRFEIFAKWRSLEAAGQLYSYLYVSIINRSINCYL